MTQSEKLHIGVLANCTPGKLGSYLGEQMLQLNVPTEIHVNPYGSFELSLATAHFEGGDLLEYKNIGNAKISFFQNSSTMKISVEGGFAPLLSVAEGCESCSPSSTEAMWMNDSYFSNSKATLNIEESTYNNKYMIFIENINKNRMNVVEEEEKQLTSLRLILLNSHRLSHTWTMWSTMLEKMNM